MISTMIDIDFIFRRMKIDVEKFYDIYYFGADKENKKLLHLHMLKMNYKPEDFENTEFIRENREKLLEKVQNIVNNWQFY